MDNIVVGFVIDKSTKNERCLRAELESDSYLCVCQAFTTLCQNDKELTNITKNKYPLFYVLDPILKVNVEMDPRRKVKSGELIEVRFALVSGERGETSDGEKRSDNVQATQAGSGLKNVTEEEVNLLLSLGMNNTNSVTGTTPTIQQETTQSTSKEKPANPVQEKPVKPANPVQEKPVKPVKPVKQNQSKKSRKRKASDSDSDDGSDYLERVQFQIRDNRAFLASQGIEALKNAPKLPKKKRGKKKDDNKENEDIERRVMPPRAAKTHKLNETYVDETEEARPGPSRRKESEGTSTTEPSGAESHVPDDSSGIRDKSAQDSDKEKELKKNAYKHKKEAREPGRRITKYILLPPFPEELKETLLKGYFDRRQMNAFLLKFVRTFTGQTYLDRSEYKCLALKVCLRFRSLNIQNPFSYMASIKRGFSCTSRADRWYQSKGKTMKYNKRKTIIVRIENSNYTEQQDESMEDMEDPEAFELSEILKLPVADMESVINAIMNTTKRNLTLATTPIWNLLDMFPYLKNAKLLILDYYCHVPITLAEVEENYKLVIDPLAHILGKEKPLTALEEIQIFHHMEKYFTTEEGFWPSIKFSDVNNPGQHALNDIPKEQSPCIVIMQQLTEVRSVILAYDGGVLVTLEMPNSLECVSLLMAGYWVFNMQYPEAYADHLEALEAILHGHLEDYKKKSKFGKILEAAASARK